MSLPVFNWLGDEIRLTRAQLAAAEARARGQYERVRSEVGGVLEDYRAAQADMRRLLRGAKLPKMEVQKEEGRKLVAKKKRLYGEYQKARRDMQEVLTIKANIDCLLGYSEPAKKKEMER